MAETLNKYKLRHKGQEVDELLDKVPTIDARVTALEQGGSDKTYVHTQSTLSRYWVVLHNLGKKPSVTITDLEDREVEADVIHISDKLLTVSFGINTTGKVYCN